MYCKVVYDVPLDRDFDYAVPAELEAKIAPGVRVTAPFGRVLTGGMVVSVSEINTAPEGIKLKEIASVVDPRPLFGSDLFPLMRFMKSRWGGPIGQILFSLVPPQPYFKPDSAPSSVVIDVKTPSFALTPSQENALKTVRSFPAYEFHPVLFNGPSYTGKTETVLRLAGDVLAGYGQALITVPDIAAARQFIAEAEERFGAANVFCWHSRMLLSKKKKYFSAVSNGLPCVVISTRSGALLPFKNLRLAAVLDEGDDNYKQEENKPYYHLRDLLLFRAKTHGCALIFASAAPSLEMLKLVQDGSVQELAFKEPVPGRAFAPQIKLTDKKGEKSRFLSDFLLEQLTENLKRKETALLILNRRGYSNAYYCLNCGAYAKCKKCGAILARENTPEKGDRLVCKKCGHTESLDQKCPQCQNLIFKSRGGGTQKIVTELSKLFPKAHLLRLDSDTLKTKAGQGFEALNALKSGSADIIVGTRLASGALRGAKVTLAAVLDAELELDSPDFRASEKYGQMLFSLRGHLSGVADGRLIIQAADKEAYDYSPLLAGDYAAAAETEMLLRESFLYPPFVRLIKVLIKAKETDLLNAETARIKRLGAGKALEVLGPVWCAKKTDVLKKQYLLFKTDEARWLDLLASLDAFAPAKKATVKVSADPYDFY
ncbi:replication restart helicase PriA [Candidatus Avelusimicrobium alvi]|uniref:replication restart helicase PriA n=1 Tax=Candidatus Avelusimicrobium alvi TaxID=3416221 RepID=UPI003D1074B8